MSKNTGLICPACKTELGTSLKCSTCSTRYPHIGDVPFLFPNPQLELARWEARAHAEQQNLRDQQQRCESSRANLDTSVKSAATTAQRLEHLSHAYQSQLECITQLLEPLLNGQPGSDNATYKALKTEPLSDSTTLFSYANNLFRDWAWGDIENQQSLDMLAKVATQPLGKTLVLGAGGGRLAWDVAGAVSMGATEVIAVDLNPFTTLAAQQITALDTALTLWEFPLSPVSVEHVAVEHKLQPSNKEPRDNLQFVLADARALPFADESFDTVLTPWFTDVVQENPADTAQRINRLLKTGGTWLNFGSVAFANADPAQCFLLAELCALVHETDFANPVVTEQRGPYLCAPYSRFGRTELLHAFAAEKLGNANSQSADNANRPHSKIPEWISDPSKPVPALEAFQEQAMATQIHAYLMSLIDGTRSITDIAQVLEQRRLMTAREAIPVVQGFLQKMHGGD